MAARRGRQSAVQAANPSQRVRSRSRLSSLRVSPPDIARDKGTAFLQSKVPVVTLLDDVVGEGDPGDRSAGGARIDVDVVARIASKEVAGNGHVRDRTKVVLDED